MSNLWGPPESLNGPAPVAPRWRLVDVATIIDTPTDHWLNGAQIYSYTCDPARTFNPCDTGTERLKAEGGVIPIPEFGAFTVYLSETCTPRSFGDDWENYRDRVVTAFLAVESQGVELELVSGAELPLNPYLGDTNLAILNSGAATAPALALGLLEDAIGETGKKGLIHVSPKGLAALASSHLITVRSDRIETWNGTPIVVGDGYIDADPDAGTSPSESTAWMFATGPVEIRRGPVFVNPPSIKEALNREQNEVSFYAERNYLVDWDTCLQAGVLIDLAQAGGGDLPAGASTSALQTQQLTSLQAIEACVCGAGSNVTIVGPLGQDPMAASVPVVIASDQTAVPVSGTVTVGGSLPAGTNNIGDVDVLSLPPIPAGTNNIGDVDVLSLPPIPAGTNNIGDVDVLSLPPIPAGTNNIGDIDVLTLPAVAGPNADDAAATGNPVPVGGRFETTPPTFTSGDRVESRYDSRGNLKVAQLVADSLSPIAVGADNADAIAVSATASRQKNLGFGYMFNGTTWDRVRNNLSVALLASAARTTTQTGADVTNYNGRGVKVILDTTTASTGSVTLSIQGKDANGVYFTMLTGAAVTTVSTNVYTLYPGLVAVANQVVADILPRTFRIVVTANNANSQTYSVGYEIIL